MKRILVVDDEPDILGLLVDLLRMEGYLASGARDGRAALDILTASGADLVITDAMMPRLGGQGLVRSMREDPGLRDVPVIIMSAAGRPEMNGFHYQEFLFKPFDLTSLLDIVERSLGE